MLIAATATLRTITIWNGVIGLGITRCRGGANHDGCRSWLHPSSRERPIRRQTLGASRLSPLRAARELPISRPHTR
jgi:hypothetical protein